MKKLFCLLVTVFLLAGCSSAPKKEDGLINSINFNSTISDVKKVESGTILTEIDTYLVYESTYAEKPATITYSFNEDSQLFEITCQLQTDYDDSAEHLDEFQGIINNFLSRFGDVTLSNEEGELDALIDSGESYWYEWDSEEIEIDAAIFYSASEERFVTSFSFFSPKNFNKE